MSPPNGTTWWVGLWLARCGRPALLYALFVQHCGWMEMAHSGARSTEQGTVDGAAPPRPECAIVSDPAPSAQ